VGDAAWISASSRSDGNRRPRRRARSRIPAHARALKKYRDRWSPVSKISDNEDATSSLGHAEVLSVEHSVGDAIPDVDHELDERTECSSVID
jgi:hypothetical protein